MDKNSAMSLTGRTQSEVQKGKFKATLNKALHRHVAILKWLPTYSKMDAVSDMIAGVTLGLTIVPQSIAYASLAGLSPEVGLNSAFAGGFLYVLFGTIKQVSIGPTSLMSLLTFEYTKNLPAEHITQYVYLLTFVCGGVELLMGLFRLGFLVDVISTPVISGFTTASALIIIVSQIKGILGVRFKSENFPDNIRKLVEHAHNSRLADAVLGVLCIIILLVLRKLKDVTIDEGNKFGKTMKKILWFVSTGRNAIVVLLCCVLTYYIESHGVNSPFLLTANVKPGLPSIRLPTFSYQQGNTTVTFVDMIEHLGSGIFVIPIVAVLINVSIAKAFATAGTIDATQEMLTLSVCNIFASCLSSMPICGAFTRSAVSNASGVRTPFSNFYSALITILALTFITPYFHLIPRATLASVLIAAVIFLVDYQIFKKLWKSCKRDLIITFTTLIVCLLRGVEVGLLVGVLCNLIHLIYLWARPTINVAKHKNEFGEYIVVTPDLGLFFPAIDHLYHTLLKVAVRNKKQLPIAVNCCFFKGIDYSAISGLSRISEDFKRREQQLVFFNATDDMIKMYKRAKLKYLQFCAFDENLDDFLFGDLANRTTYPDFNHEHDVPLLDKNQRDIYSSKKELTPSENERNCVTLTIAE